MAARLPSTIVEEESIGGQLNDQRRVHFSPAKGFAGLQGYDRQSKTMSHATWGMNNTPFQQPNNPPRTSNFTDTSHFVESNGLGLRPAMNALFPAGYGQRKAKDRIFWVFPPENDRRVSLLLRWINDMNQAIGVYGLQKFLQSRERGALVTNANYRKPGHETEPAWDWLTFDQLQTSRDKTFQELVACYDPAEIVVVFVYLPSESGRSVAMWRRKIPVPAHVRQTHQRQIDEVKHHLRRFEEYVVHVDEYVYMFCLILGRN
ncbi:hypothetical protein FISHEDRAFT_48251 [Fistulina hepatica ATCC 64428]|uniref:CcmS related domain-containing protein n=1 Tax=Fistulina hepatica ATCC 64428 TaxID=1128425 RepID=A0A0D7A646_9AGAR|nr:hypothetical protein FISHEDRAFT_48251 [Fistulina hepatica ATCC 64428]